MDWEANGRAPWERFRHCPACGSGAVEARTPPQLVCRSCGFHFYFNPAVAAAALIIDEEDRVLLLRRQREPRKGYWALPGGFVDMGERVEDGLRREIREEVGLEPEQFLFVASFPNQYPFKGVTYPVLDFFFETRVSSVELKLDLEEASEHRWVRREEINLEEIAFPSLQGAIRLWLERQG
ncbi:MAG: hypothetical protein OHK005_09980 [Candidatus Methylacidiphilales bacterium]